MKMRCATAFISSVVFILLATALAKIYSLVFYHQFLRGLDPLLEVKSDVLLGFSAFMEIGVAGFLLSRRHLQSKLLAILWLSCLFILYRFGLISIGFNKPCPCLGAPNSWMLMEFIPWDMIMKCALAYMFLLSAAFLLFWIRPYERINVH